jgi:hypothetical protein
MMKSKMNDLLQSVGEIVSKYPHNEKIEDPMNFFRILGIQNREVYLCRVLAKLIDPNAHDKGADFLKLFFEWVLKLPITVSECQKAAVYTEYVIEKNRRIDILIRCEKYTIPIEAKVYEGDQRAQLLDYSKYAQGAHIYYLTLDGRLPGEKSITREDGGRLRDEEYCCISFLQHIVAWIDSCLMICDGLSSAATVLCQFRDILVENNMEERSEMAMEIARDLINNSESFEAAMAIEKGLQEAKMQKMQQFFSAITERLSK